MHRPLAMFVALMVIAGGCGGGGGGGGGGDGGDDGGGDGASTPVTAFVYVPRGVPSLDLELLNDNGGTVKLFTRGVVTGEPYTSREVTLGGRGTTRIPLLSTEEGGLAAFTWPGFLFSVLYSVPQRWARSPAALLVPRAVATADGLSDR